ncbi:YdcF family protein [Hymenobacter negativus]|uniref:YdcF family protein n=1 Tax=Hymenobacter negativus TaxID=2795026 RepID=A0ABS3QNG7_9BACT|nr:YdcF family protein [Hymenobacter negativus]MBO2012826.1 YdcF family protein [Hymenobacter negativus]
MFFLLSKLLLVLFSPGAWLLVLLIAALVARPLGRWRRRWLWAAAIVLFLGGNNGLVNLALRAWELPAVPLATVAPANAAVLLTGITADNAPHDRVYLSNGADRFTNALWLYRAKRVRRIIISGGTGSTDPRTVTEAAELATLLRLSGVPQRDLLLEERSRNTRENALYTKALLAQHPDIKTLVLVTSAFHERRALACFAKVGLHPAAFPADFRNTGLNGGLSFWLVPDVDALNRWSILLHEMAGYVIYRVMGYC